eukprot:m.186842 g.186842  ORF g.186842 m.186842 type:complete len:921 (+) comp15598_c0_seq10:228-2990(+)
MDSDSILLQGPLTKIGQIFKTWRKRWFVLVKGCPIMHVDEDGKGIRCKGRLLYFSDESMKVCRGEIHAYDLVAVRDAPTSDKVNELQVEIKSGRVYRILAGSDSTKNTWIATLNSIMTQQSTEERSSSEAMEAWKRANPETMAVFKGQDAPPWFSWQKVAEGICALLSLKAKVPDEIGTEELNTIMFRTLAHSDIFVRGDHTGNEEYTPSKWFKTIKDTSGLYLRKLATTLHSAAEALGLATSLDLPSLAPERMEQQKMRTQIVSASSQFMAALEEKRQKLHQSDYLPYFSLELDQDVIQFVDTHQLSEQSVLLAVLAIHTAYLHTCLAAHIKADSKKFGKIILPECKNMERMRSKAMTDYSEGVGVRRTEVWYPGDELGGYPSCRPMRNEQQNKGKARWRMHARTVGALGCVLDSLRFSLVVSTDLGLAAQEGCIKDMCSRPEWEFLGQSQENSTMADPRAIVKRSCVHLLYTPASATISNVTELMKKSARKRMTYYDMTSDPKFDQIAKEVQDREYIDDEVFRCAMQMLKSELLSERSVGMVVEMQLYTDYFLEREIEYHSFHRIHNAIRVTDLTLECAPYHTNASMACTGSLARYRTVLGLYNKVKLEQEMGHIEYDKIAWETIAEILSKDKTLTTMSFRGAHMKDNEALLVSAAMKLNSTVTDLILINNEIGDVGTAAISEALKHNNTLTALRLASNSIGDAGASTLGDAVRGEHCILETLSLKLNKIADRGLKAFAQGLKANYSLSEIDLSNNAFGDKGAEELGLALRVNSTLTVLSLATNKIGDAGATDLAMGLKLNTTLQEIDLSANLISDAGASLFGLRVFNSESALTAINLGGNKIGDTGAKDLGAGLKQNKNLRVLDLSGNIIGDSGAKHLIQATKCCSMLASLNLQKNALTPKGLKKHGKRENAQIKLT